MFPNHLVCEHHFPAFITHINPAFLIPDFDRVWETPISGILGGSLNPNGLEFKLLASAFSAPELFLKGQCGLVS
jgi:hypothetical protein